VAGESRNLFEPHPAPEDKAAYHDKGRPVALSDERARREPSMEYLGAKLKSQSVRGWLGPRSPASRLSSIAVPTRGFPANMALQYLRRAGPEDKPAGVNSFAPVLTALSPDPMLPREGAPSGARKLSMEEP
jgi:hypothetical protein